MGAHMMFNSRQFIAFAAMAALIAGEPTLAIAAGQTTTPSPAARKHPAPAQAAGPKQIGKFDDWTAATHQESNQTVCYAFTRAQNSVPASTNRGPVILTVTERAGLRDTVAMDAGFTYAANAAVTVQVDQTGLDFYTSGRNAFAREGKAAVAAFSKGARAIARARLVAAGIAA
jgi:invasion protein IalB